jgi:hypothetical protein
MESQEADLSWNRTLERMIDHGFVEKYTGRIKLTEDGRRFADSVAVALL